MVALPRDPSQLPAPLLDGRMLHSSKPHSYEKLFYWSRVLQEFARLTKNSWAGKRVCIDLFAGCGIYRDIETRKLGWGSPLLALHATRANVTRLADDHRHDALAPRRQATAPTRGPCLLICGGRV